MQRWAGRANSSTPSSDRKVHFEAVGESFDVDVAAEAGAEVGAEINNHIAEEGRRRAAMRIKETRQKMLQREEEQRRLEQLERSKKWAKRDEQVPIIH